MKRPPMSAAERRGGLRFLALLVVIALLAITATSGPLRSLVGSVLGLAVMLVAMNLFSRR